MGSETGERQHVLLVGDVLNVLVFHHRFLIHGSQDVQVQAVAVFGGSFHRLPDRLLLAHPIQNPVNLLVRHLHRLGLHSDLAIAGQVHRRFQRHRRREGHRLKLGNFDARLPERRNFLVLEDLVQRLRHHELQRFLEQSGAPHHAFHDVPRRPSPAEPRDVQARNDPTVRALNERILILRGQFHRQRDLNW